MNSFLTDSEKTRFGLLYQIIKKLNLKDFKILANNYSTVCNFDKYFKNIKHEATKENIRENMRKCYISDHKMSLVDKIDIEFYIQSMDENSNVSKKMTYFNVIVREFFNIIIDTEITICLISPEYEFRYTRIDRENYIFQSTHDDFPLVTFSCSLIKELKLVNLFHKSAKQHKITDIINIGEIINSMNTLILEHLDTLDLSEVHAIKLIDSNLKCKDIDVSFLDE